MHVWWWHHVFGFVSAKCLSVLEKTENHQEYSHCPHFICIAGHLLLVWYVWFRWRKWKEKCIEHRTLNRTKHEKDNVLVENSFINLLTNKCNVKPLPRHRVVYYKHYGIQYMRFHWKNSIIWSIKSHWDKIYLVMNVKTSDFFILTLAFLYFHVNNNKTIKKGSFCSFFSYFLFASLSPSPLTKLSMNG